MGRHRARAGMALLLWASATLAGVGAGIGAGGGAGVGVPAAWATEPGPYPGAVLFRPDGVLRSSPATVHQPSFGRAVFVTGTDGGVWWSSDQHGWLALGSPPGMAVVGDPAAVSWGDGRIDVFVRGGDDRLWQQWTSCGGCAWSGWSKPVGNEGTLASSPTATSWGPGRIDVFVTGTDGGVYQRFWDTSSWSPEWVAHGGVARGRPGAASWGPGRLDVFAQGVDGRLWQQFWAGSGWSGWFQPPGTELGVLASPPSPAPWTLGSRNRLTVFVRGTDGRLYQATWDGAWAAWTAVGAPHDVIVGSPGVAGTLQFAPSVLARGTDDRVYLFSPNDPLGTAVADFVASRADNVTAAVYDVTTGQTFTFRPGVVEHTASTVKVDILATLLTQAQAEGRGLTAEEQSLAVPMIEQSLDSAASALWVRLGPAAIGAFERAAGMTQTSPATDGIWGTTTTTALDRIAMVRQLAFPGPLLSDASRAYVLGLMEHVVPSQAWGVTGGVPAGVTVALKNGFSIINGWQINSMGWVDGAGRNYLIAVLTDGNPSEDYGIQTVTGISAIVWDALGP